MNAEEDKKFYARALTMELAELLRKIYGYSRSDNRIPELARHLTQVACKNAVNNFFHGYLVELRDPNSNLTFAAVFNYHLHGRCMVIPGTSIGQPPLPRNGNRAISISYIASSPNFEATDNPGRLLAEIENGIRLNVLSVEQARGRIADCNHHQVTHKTGYGDGGYSVVYLAKQ